MVGPVGEGRLLREEGERSIAGGGNCAARHSSRPCGEEVSDAT